MREFEVESEMQEKKGTRGGLWVAYLCVFSDAVCFTYIFAFLPYYVEFLIAPQLLGLDKQQRDAEVAYHSGVLGTSYSVGQIISAFAMGTLSDKIGRRPVLIVGTGATVIITGVFGFIPTFYLAVFVRFMNGLCNAVIVAARAMLSDYTEDENRVNAFVRLNKYGLMGIILGPCIGGGLSEPNKHLPDVFHSPMFDLFPFLLPCLFCFCVSLLTFLIVLKYAKDKPKVAAPLLETPTMPLSRSEAFAVLRSNTQFWTACLCWSLNAFTGSMYIELLGLWCKTTKESGGLGWAQEAKLSAVLLCGSVGLLLFLATGLQRLIHCSSTGTVLRVATTVNAFSFLVIPRISDLPSSLIWPVLLTCSVVSSISMGASVTSINIIINSVVSKDLYGAANGLGISIVALVRAFGPITAGSVFGWSISDTRSFPLDRSLAFLVAAGFNAVNVAIARSSILP